MKHSELWSLQPASYLPSLHGWSHVLWSSVRPSSFRLHVKSTALLNTDMRMPWVSLPYCFPWLRLFSSSLWVSIFSLLHPVSFLMAEVMSSSIVSFPRLRIESHPRQKLSPLLSRKHIHDSRLCKEMFLGFLVSPFRDVQKCSVYSAPGHKENQHGFYLRKISLPMNFMSFHFL